MGARSKRDKQKLPSPDFFDLAGSDPDLLNSGRIPDPQPAHTPLFRWLAKVFTAVEARLRARGNLSLRYTIRFFWCLVGIIGLFLLVGPIINQPMTFDEVIDSADIKTVDWIATDVEIDYEVSRGDGGEFVAQVRESYVANFTNGPESNVERVLVTEYQGRDVEFALGEVTVDGAKAAVTVDRKPTTTSIRVSRADGEKFDGTAQIEFHYTLHHLVSMDIDDATGREADKWSWPLFAPTWPQAMKGIEVSLTLSHEVNDALMRQPRAYVGWLLVSGTEWLSPEGESAFGVSYSFSNDDSLPPNSDVWLIVAFKPDTFTLPPTTGLFWLQSWGPLIPIAFLLVLLLFALAARRIVWADSAGDPWYLPRNEPPDDLSPARAAHLLGNRRHDELVSALVGDVGDVGDKGAAADTVAMGQGSSLTKSGKRKPNKSSKKLLNAKSARRTELVRKRWLIRVAEAAQRAGRIGSLYAVMLRTAGWAANDVTVKQELRWVPNSYIRDTFLLAPLAITLLQWGLLRQLSHQVILLVIWWPAVFVLVSTVLALVIVVLVWRPRPLTPEGALTMQQLKGIDVWARATRLLDRGPLDDKLLPYAVLFESPRQAGQAIYTHAVRETGDRSLGQNWRTKDFISVPALLGFVAALAVLTTSIVTVSTKPAPYDIDMRHVTQYSDLTGTFYTQITGFELEAELSRSPEGQALIEVVEHLTVLFDDNSAVAPQFEREWTTTRLGQDRGFELTSVTLDGAQVPYRQFEHEHTNSTVLHTQMQEVLGGEHTFEVRYTLHSAAVDRSDINSSYQEVRWAGLLSFWDDTYYTNPSNAFDGTAPVRPIRVTFTIAQDLVDQVKHAGWIDFDFDRPRVPHERGNVSLPWVIESIGYPYEKGGAYDVRLGSESLSADGSLVASIDVDEMQLRPRVYGDEPVEEFMIDAELNAAANRFEFGLRDDLGVLLRFADGTFTGIEKGAAEQYFSKYWSPYAIMLALAGLIMIFSLVILVVAIRWHGQASASLSLTSFATIPILFVAQCVLFMWTVMSMAGGSAQGWVAIWVGVALIASVTAQIVMVSRRRLTGRSTA
ncbi:MAG: DUF2207 domain-containing protein [Leucobacter sp.]|nr:DUF2207 domain-containing protein [Leucobacter sp.]